MASSIAAKSEPIPQGIYCPVISLYRPTPRQEVDYEASYKFFLHLIRSGVDGLVLAGTTAEAVLLSAEERKELIKVARKAASDSGRPDFPILSGISGQSTVESIRLAEDALSVGADFGLLLPLSYWAKAVTKEAILGFYHDVADATALPIVIYSFPAMCNGVDLSSDTLSELAQLPNIVGVKLTCGNAGKVTRLTQEYTHGQFGVFAGSSDWLLPCLIGSGGGCVTGIANVFPKCVARLYALWNEDKIKEAKELQGLVAQAEKACKEGIAPTKYATGHFAGPSAGVTEPAAFWPRKPYLPCDPQKAVWVENVMQHLVQLEQSLPDVI
ncbi:Putative Dihydrodipicolinate synthase [Penicillium brasilianum]|uniref:Putative Dihydrodipicolinate synthase n=1 Tax=Penicillium brasilianum TaxID=104259 RepID=A0A0F7VAZ1_PENBI|nr:Putative Dihydrodipicolinate synthase [Penicillium brasilianum]